MKFIFTFCLVLASLVVLSCARELDDIDNLVRAKRSLSQEDCPKNSTPAQCEEYAKSVSKRIKYCHTFVLGEGGIEWQSCGTVSCAGDLKVLPEDLSKPYPACCEECGI